MTPLHCKFCDTHATHAEPICAKCLPAFSTGERAGKNRLIKDTCQELREIIRFMEEKIL